MRLIVLALVVAALLGGLFVGNIQGGTDPMANPAASFPAAAHSATDISAFTATALGSSSPTHTGVEGKQEEELEAITKRLLGTALNVQGEYGAVGDGVENDTTALQNAIDAAIAAGVPVYLPAGIYRIADTLEYQSPTAEDKALYLIGATATSNGEGGTTIIWDGAANGTMMQMLGLSKVVMRDIRLDADQIADKCFYTEWTTGDDGNNPFGWEFDNCSFENALVAQFDVDGADACGRFNFNNCWLTPRGLSEPGLSVATNLGIGFRVNGNHNALTHRFTNCFLGYGSYGAYLDSGSATFLDCDFGLNSAADIYLNTGGTVTCINTWSERSRQFIINAGAANPIAARATLVGCTVTSSPWDWWKRGDETVAKPSAAVMFAPITWDNGLLTLVGCHFWDSYAGAETGLTAPLTCDTMRVYVDTIGTYEQDISIINSHYTEGTSIVAPIGIYTDIGYLDVGNDGRIAGQRYLDANGVILPNNVTTALSAAYSINTAWRNVVELTTDDDYTVTLANPEYIGKRVTLILTGTNAKVITIDNLVLAGGTALTMATDTALVIDIVYVGSYGSLSGKWVEIARSAVSTV